MPPLMAVSIRSVPPMRMQVSVPGMYQKPAPYREQTFTYSTALALTGRSAACAPAMASTLAAEPRTRLLIIFMLNLQVALIREGFRIRWVRHPGVGSLVPSTRRLVASRLRTHPLNARDLSERPKTGRLRDAPLRRTTTITERPCTRNKGTARNRHIQRVFGHVLHK